MYTLLLFIVFIGCFFWYCSSSKVKLQYAPAVVLRLSKDKKRARTLGIFLLAIAYLFTLYLQGLLTGTLAFVTYVMGFFSLIVLLWPYRYFKWRQILFVGILSLILEIIIF